MRVRPQSYLLPAALLLYLFFSTAAHSEKKNSILGGETEGDKNFYNDNYKKKVAGSDRDIISYNKIDKNSEDYQDYNEKRELVKPGVKKESNTQSKNEKKKSSNQKSTEDFCYYIVKKGDTLFSIAKRSGISLKKIQDINNIDEDSKLYKGMKLKIPSGKEIKVSTREIDKNCNNSSEKISVSSKPLFLWPLKKIKGFSRDGKDGVKPIGIIIKGIPGSEVIASENGVVKKVGYMRGYGKYIVVKHGKRYITVYSNLMEVDVKAGDTVQKGGRIGNISDDMTLHFQIDREGKPENPLSLLPGRS